MSFKSGAAVFNRCFKPAAIKEFTAHLRNHPNDQKALRWRAQAFSIVNKPDDAMRDIEKAIEVSGGVQRELARAEKYLLLGALAEFGNIARRITEENPESWEGWGKLGQYHLSNGDLEETVNCYRTALDIARESGETNDPQICWINRRLGIIWFERGELEIAADYYRAGVESCPTHTASYIGLVLTCLCQGNFDEARSNFEKAKDLNPELVLSEFEADTFDDFLVKLKRKQQVQQQHFSAAERKPEKTTNRKSGKNTGGGSGSSSGTDSEDEKKGNKDNQCVVSVTWKRLQKESPCIMLYRRHKYVQSKCKDYWYSKDTAGHAGAAFKRYKNTGSSLRFLDSLDKNMQPMTNKHESNANTVIYKNEMTGVRGK